MVPQVEQRGEVRALVDEAGVRGVGLAALGLRALAGVLDGQPGDDDHHLPHAPGLGCGQDHAAQSGVERQARELLAEGRQPRRPATVLQRAQLLEKGDPVADLPGVRRVEEGEALDLPEAQRGHLQDHRREVGAQDLRVGELRAVEEVLLGVEADGDAVANAAAPPGALVGRRLGDRLDRQPLHLQSLAVAGDACGARVDDVADPRNGDRRLGDVGGQDHAAPTARGEDPVLLGGAQACVQRQHRGRDIEHRPQCVGHVVDLALRRRGTPARRRRLRSGTP